MNHPHQTRPTLKKRTVLAVTNDLVTDNRIHKVATTLSRMGFDVTLVGRKLSTSAVLQKQEYSNRRFSLWFNKGPLFYANYNIRLFIYLLFQRFDVIVSNDLDTLAACFYAGKMIKKPVVYDSHEYFTEVPELVDRTWVKNQWTRIEKSIVPKLQTCYTVCQSIADIYTKQYGTPFRVVRNIPFSATEDLATKPSIAIFPTNLPVILYQGAINKGRGIEEAIIAMHAVEGARLVIIGDGDLLETCKNMVNNEQLNDKVFFTGRIPFTELRSQTSLATIGLSIEQDIGLNYHYALPNKLFDYIQSGVPILASCLPEIKNIVDKYDIGLTLPETTSSAIAHQLNELLQSTERMNTWRANCKKASKILCWEKEEKIIQDIYHKFIM